MDMDSTCTMFDINNPNPNRSVPLGPKLGAIWAPAREYGPMFQVFYVLYFMEMSCIFIFVGRLIILKIALILSQLI